LFKDHIVTLNLIEGANHEFTLILESYLLCAVWFYNGFEYKIKFKI